MHAGSQQQFLQVGDAGCRGIEAARPATQQDLGEADGLLADWFSGGQTLILQPGRADVVS
jgi:hypothetical protein